MAKLKARLESAQHILHHMLTHDYRAVQTGMQIYDNKIRIDVRCTDKDLTTLSKEEFEGRVNGIILRDLPVEKTIYPRDKVPKNIDISMIPASAKEIRIVDIKDFDMQPCGNAHVDNTSEIGEYRIIEIKRKGKDIYRFVGEVVDKGTAKVEVKKESGSKPMKFELQLAKGVRDFPPEEKIIRDEIIRTIIDTFEIYGFNPIETPILERYDTLAAKFAAGEASDALKETFQLIDQGKRKLGLRFDLTIPFCRFVGMNPNMKMPFKKYLIGEVFRDGPIKTGRYRQFMQMDPDIVGTDSMLADAEILALSDAIFKKLGFDITIELNDRKLLDGILEYASIPEELRFEVMVSIDKLKKIGENGVRKELNEKNIDTKTIDKILSCFVEKKDNRSTLKNLKDILKNKTGQEGLKEMGELLDYLDWFGIKSVIFLPSLARGLAYYTGPVYEILLNDSSITSSAAGGGRYDKIIGSYLNSKQTYPATGISFGIEVIIEALKQKRKLTRKSIVDAYVIPIKTTKQSIEIVQILRQAGIKTDFDIMGRGISKNLQYANAYNIPYVIFIGEDELKNKAVKIKDMISGKESLVKISKIVEFFRK
ncbi:MAG: histidine--tRNA ligase [Nanoarchaeota archaeon]|nr:histidine--tRNA ligase [Nanoarchaeota archaeon]